MTKAAEIRIELDAKLLASDWIVARSYGQGVLVPEAWVAYRQALRDITQQPEFSLDNHMANNLKLTFKKSRETATGAGSALVAFAIAFHAILDLVGVICSKLF